jgi:hypothetical protein
LTFLLEAGAFAKHSQVCQKIEEIQGRADVVQVAVLILRRIVLLAYPVDAFVACLEGHDVTSEQVP